MESAGPNEALLGRVQLKRSSSRSWRSLGVVLSVVGAMAVALFLVSASHRQSAEQLPRERQAQMLMRPRLPASTRVDSPPPPLPPVAVPPPSPSGPTPLPQCHFAKANGQPGTSTTRAVEFVNDCDGQLMVNLQGFTWPEPANFSMHELPGGGGFALPAGERTLFNISERLFSGRIWCAALDAAAARAMRAPAQAPC